MINVEEGSGDDDAVLLKKLLGLRSVISEYAQANTGAWAKKLEKSLQDLRNNVHGHLSARAKILTEQKLLVREPESEEQDVVQRPLDDLIQQRWPTTTQVCRKLCCGNASRTSQPWANMPG